MRLAITALVFVGGLFFSLLSLSFLFQPSAAITEFGLTPTNPMGLANARADFFAYFAILGAGMIWGAWKRRGDVLLVPAVIMLLALIARLVGAAIEGINDGFVFAAAMEGGFAALLFFARMVLPHHPVQDVGD